MKNYLKKFCFLLAAALLLGGCAGKTSQHSEKPLIIASFYPMYDLAVKAAGDFADVRCMIADGTEPHDWEPTPQDIVRLQQADLFFYSGAGFETWVEDVLATAQNPKLIAVETAKDVPLLPGDPHTWLSPINAKLQMQAMTAALMEADPTHADDYSANFTRWAEEFDKLDREFEGLKALNNHKIIVAHAAFGYLCEAYGIEQISAKGFSPDDEPDPARMAQVVKLARENAIKVIFFEELASPKVAETIAREIGAQTAVLSPLEGLSEEQRAAGGDYFSVMRENLAALKGALE